MQPEQIQRHVDRALRHYADGELSDTEALCREVLAADPRQPEMLHLLGTLAHRSGHADDAIDLMRRAIAFTPDVPAYHSNVGVALTVAGRYDEAIAACREAIRLDPTLVDAYFNLGNALREAGRPDDAADAYRHAVSQRPGFAPAHHNLGNVLRDGGRFAAALESWREALLLEPDDAIARGNLADALEQIGDADEALDEHRRAVETAPMSAALHSGLIRCLQRRPGADPTSVATECRSWDARHAPKLAADARLPVSDPPPTGGVRRPLRVAFLVEAPASPAIVRLLLPVLRRLDRSTLHVSGYGTQRADEPSSPFDGAFDAWHGLAGVPDDEAVRRLRADRIDVLVDLAGHARGNRLTLIARHPVSTVVGLPGFPGTTGLAAVTDRLTDPYLDPPSADAFHDERLVRFSPNAWCFAPPPDAPPVGVGPAASGGHVTFGSFVGLENVAPSMIASWSDLLRRLPSARIVLRSRALGDDRIADRVARRFAGHGVEPSRLTLRADARTLDDRLRAHAEVDVALDGSCDGATATCEALWMGVPVVTLAGRGPASRVGASLLANAGCRELIADTPASYVERAVALAADRPRLAAYRRDLRARLQASPLTDVDRFARHLETVLHAVWRERGAGGREEP